MKRHQTFRRLCTAAIAFTLSTSMVAPVLADGTEAVAVQERIALETSIGSVYISGNSYFMIKKASVLPSEDGKTAAFTVTLHNGDNTDIQFIDYWIRLKSKSGTSYGVTLMAQDKDKNRVPANSEAEFNFYAKVGSDVDLNDLVFTIIKWDFNAFNFERKIGEIEVPADYSALTLIGEKRIVSASGTQLKTGISKVLINQNRDNHFVSLYYDIVNVGSKSITLPGYSFYVRTPQGFMYPLDGSSAKDLTIHPLSSKEVRLTGTIPVTIAQEGWQLVVTETDSASKVLRAVAYYELPQGTSEDVSTGINEKKSIAVDDKSLNVSVKRVSMNKNDVNYRTTVYFTLENAGNETVSVPNYRFVLRTGEGLSYPVTASGLDKLTILPRASKDIQLSVAIPVSVNVDQLELIMNQPASQGGTGNTQQPNGSFDYPIASFKLPAPSQNEGVVGSLSEFTNKNGIYGLKFDGVQRLPWEDKDIIAAEFSLLNKGSTPLPLPALTGYFLLDGSVKVPAKLIQTDNVISVRNESDSGFSLVGSIPYTYDYSELKLVIQEKLSDSEINDVVEFKHDKNEPAIPLIDISDKYTLDAIGRKSSFSLRESRTYSGSDSDLYTVQLSVENLEKRFANITKLVGFFKTKDDLVFAAKISEVSKKISPLGKATLYVTTTLPKNFDTSGMQLILGEGIRDTKLATGTDAPDGFINGVAFAVPPERKTAQQNFNNIDLFPFTLSVNKINATTVESNKFTLSFDYALSKNTFVETGADEHTVIVEFEDPAGGYKFEQKYTLGKGTDNEAAGNLVIGKNTKTIVKTDQALMFKLPYLQSYKINIYDEFLGQKKLVASQTINWFVTSE